MFVVPDGGGGMRLSSQAFQNQSDPDGTEAMSVFVEERLNDLGADHLAVVEGFPGYGLASFSARVPRDHSLPVVWAPTDAGLRGQAHANVLGKKTRSIQKALATASSMRVWPHSADDSA